MANKKKTAKRVLPDEIPNLEVPTDVLVENFQEPTWENNNEQGPRYVVVRSGLRVSDKDYPTPSETGAIAEKDFWQRVVDRHPDGTKVEIVEFDKKKHRIW